MNKPKFISSALTTIEAKFFQGDKLISQSASATSRIIAKTEQLARDKASKLSNLLALKAVNASLPLKAVNDSLPPERGNTFYLNYFESSTIDGYSSLSKNSILTSYSSVPYTLTRLASQYTNFLSNLMYADIGLKELPNGQLSVYLYASSTSSSITATIIGYLRYVDGSLYKLCESNPVPLIYNTEMSLFVINNTITSGPYQVSAANDAQLEIHLVLKNDSTATETATVSYQQDGAYSYVIPIESPRTTYTSSTTVSTTHTV